MGGKTVAQGMAAGPFGDAGPADRIFHLALQGLLIDMMAPDLPGPGIF